MNITINKYLIFLLLILHAVISYSQEEKDRKWQYGVGVGLHQLPFMKGESIEDKSLDLGWSFGIITERFFRKNKTYSIGINLFYFSEKNEFQFLPYYALPNESPIKENIFIKTRREIIRIGFDFKYFILENRSRFFVGCKLDLFSFPYKKFHPEYETQIIPKNYLLVDDYFLHRYFKPNLVFGRDFDFNTLNGRIQFTLGGNYLYMEPQKDVLIYSFDPNLTPVFSYPKEGFLEVGLSILILLNVN